MEKSNEKIAGEILSEYGILIKPSDDIIPFYGMLMDLRQKMENSKPTGEQLSIHFENNQQAFYYGFGKWLNISIVIVTSVIGFLILMKSNNSEIPNGFMKNSILVTSKKSNGKTLTGYLLHKGEKETYIPGKHYIPGKTDGSIVVPIE